MSAGPAAGVPIAHAGAVPEVLITAESQSAAPRPDGVEVHLENVDAEADAIQAAYGGEANAEVQRNISVSDFVRLIAGRTTWCFPGHGDAMLQSEPTLAFVGEGDAIEVVSIDTLVGIVRPHVLTGKLKLIVLTGCCTARLAAALRERAFVPHVLCWETVLNDEAGRIFGTAFAQAIADKAEPPAAFEKARTAVCTETEPGNLDTGLGARVQKFELDIDPKDATKVHAVSGRLLLHPGAPRGRLAAGTPKLLRESTPLHDVPPLPAHYMPRPEQWDLRNALVTGVRGDGTVVGIVGASPVTGIAGTAGLGKTTTASWLARDSCVRSAFRDGVFWLEFGKERTAMQRLVRLAELLEVPAEDLERLERRGMDSLRDEVARLLRDRSCLIILDDVGDQEQPKPFRELAVGQVTVMMTTRKSFIVETFGQQLARLELRPMEDEDAKRLMAQSSGKASVDELNGPSLAKLVKMCAGVPALLRSVGRMCNTRSAEAIVQWFADHKLRHRLPASMARADGYQQDAAEGNLFLAYEGQLDGLAERDEELVTRCTMCGVFPEDTEVPLEVLSDLWSTDEAETREVVERLTGEHLVELIADGARIKLLDPVLDYLRCRGKSALEGWHARLLGACQARQVGGGSRGYWDGRDGGRHFIHHLNGCNGKLGEGLLGAIEKLYLRPIVWWPAEANAANLTAILKRTKIISLDLYVSYNLPGPNGGIALADGLRGNTTLQSLNLQGNKLGPEGGAALAEALKGNSTLQSLDLKDTDIGGKGASALAAVLKEAQITNLNVDGHALQIDELQGRKPTEKIDLSDKQLCNASAIIIASCIKENSVLKELRLNTNHIGDEGASALAAVLKETQITKLSLCHNVITGDAAVATLANVVLEHTIMTDFCGIPLASLREDSVTELNLRGKGVGMPGAIVLSKLLPSAAAITSLILAGNMLCGGRHRNCDDFSPTYTYITEAITQLCEALKGGAVTSLNLSANYIGNAGASALAAVLQETQITTLILAHNELCGPYELCTVETEWEYDRVDDPGRGATYTTEGIIKLCEALKGSEVTSLDVQGDGFGPRGGAALAEGLKGNTTLQSLNLASNALVWSADISKSKVQGSSFEVGAKVTYEECEVTVSRAPDSDGDMEIIDLSGVWALAASLPDLSGNNLGSDGGAALAAGLKGNLTLRSLDIGYNDVGDEGASALAAILKETMICNLDLKYNNIGDEGASALAAIKETQITNLDLSGNKLCGVDWRDSRGTYTTEGITKLCEGLKGSAVTSLILQDIGLGPEGGAALAEGLKGNWTLQSLNLASCNELCGLDILRESGLGTHTTEDITELSEVLMGGITKLCEALKESAVTSLDISFNRLGPEGGLALTKGLAGNTTLRKLDLADNMLCSMKYGGGGPYNFEGITKFCEALKGSAMTSLNLASNYLGPKGGAAIAEVLKGNSMLQSLDLHRNQLGPEGGAALAEGLKGNSTLRSLDLAYNQLCGLDGSSTYIVGTYTAGGINKLCEGLKGSAVTSLDLTGNHLSGNDPFGGGTYYYNAEGIIKLCEGSPYY